jgi:hypothetical protein
LQKQASPTSPPKLQDYTSTENLLLVTSRIREYFFFFTCIYILQSLASYSTLCPCVWLCMCVCVVRECACVKTLKAQLTPSRTHLSHTQNTSAQTHTHTCAPLASSVASSHSSCCCCILKYVDRAHGRQRAGTAAKFPDVDTAGPYLAICDGWHEGNATPHEWNAWLPSHQCDSGWGFHHARACMNT